jgi:hypothetical protein
VEAVPVNQQKESQEVTTFSIDACTACQRTLKEVEKLMHTGLCNVCHKFIMESNE